MRRALLQLLAGAPFARGDGLRRPVNAPQPQQVYPGVQPGVTPGVTVANQVIVVGPGPSGGIYVYSGQPASGNLIESIGITAGTTLDPFGLNAVLPGDSRYHNNGTTFVAQQSTQGIIADLWQATSALGPYTSTGVQIGFANEFTASPKLQLVALPAGSIIELDSATSILAALTATAGSAASPTLITTDNWESGFSYQNSWGATAGGYPNQFRLLPDGTVLLYADVSGGTITNGTNMFQLTTTPTAAYTPKALTPIPCIVKAGATASPTNSPHVQITTSRVVQCENLPTGTTRVVIAGIYPAAF